MLTRFAVNNYRGFSKKIEWDLSSPGKYDFNNYAVKDGVVKSGVIYGPNGMGKSNFGLAIFDIVNHLSQKWKKPDYYRNFVYAGNPDSPVSFEYGFKFGDTHLEYAYSKDKIGNLLSETLTCNGEVVLKQDSTESNVFASPEFPIEESVKKKFANSANRVSLVAFILGAMPLEKDHYLVKLNQFVGNMLWFSSVEGNQFIGMETIVESIEEFIIRQNITKDFQNFLNEVSNQTFDFVTPSTSDKLILCNINGGRIPFIEISSTGTKSLTLLYYWLKKIDSHSFIFIDEFDAFYHFKLAFNVCKRLFNLDCQVFTSSHNTSLMTNDLLRPDCNFILDNNIIKPLCDCTEKELRFAHNMEKLYRGGTFSTGTL